MWDTSLQTLMFDRMIGRMKDFFTIVGLVMPPRSTCSSRCSAATPSGRLYKALVETKKASSVGS